MLKIMENSKRIIPMNFSKVRLSFQSIIPNKNGMINENEAIMLVKAIGPMERALNPVCMEIQRDIPYPIPKRMV